MSARIIYTTLQAETHADAWIRPTSLRKGRLSGFNALRPIHQKPAAEASAAGISLIRFYLVIKSANLDIVVCRNTCQRTLNQCRIKDVDVAVAIHVGGFFIELGKRDTA